MKNKNAYEFVERLDNIGRIIQGNSDYGEKIPLPLMQTLIKQYDYLFQAMSKEKFFIDENFEIALMKEIVCDKKVVGFSGWRYSHYGMILILIYILPEYRGKNLLYSDLMDSEKIFSKPVAIDCPNQYVVKSLIKNNLARYINKYLVISDIPFTFTITELDEDMKSHVENNINLYDSNALLAFSYIYDTNISAIVSLKNEISPDLISPVLDVDIRDFDAFNKRLSFNPDIYFDKIKKDLESIE